MGRARFVNLRALAGAGAGANRAKDPAAGLDDLGARVDAIKRDKTRRIDEENYFQRIRVFPPLDRSPDGAFRPTRSSSKRDRKEEEKASREMQRG